MYRIAKFEKVSFNQFCRDFYKINETDANMFENETELKNIYESIKLPERSTAGSAGYDFFAPADVNLNFNTNITIPSGIKCRIEEGWVLLLLPRSSTGFKSGTHLSNTIGVIDADYYNNQNNEGHILCKFTNDDATFAKDIFIKQGDKYCQGIFIPFGITENDKTTETRTGGIGSTDK